MKPLLASAHKGYRTHFPGPQTGESFPLFNPRLHRWAAHFAWIDDGTRILGQTPSGRATMVALQMNDPLVVRARGLWVSAGWHPPKD